MCGEFRRRPIVYSGRTVVAGYKISKTTDANLKWKVLSGKSEKGKIEYTGSGRQSKSGEGKTSEKKILEGRETSRDRRVGQ